MTQIKFIVLIAGVLFSLIACTEKSASNSDKLPSNPQSLESATENSNAPKAPQTQPAPSEELSVSAMASREICKWLEESSKNGGFSLNQSLFICNSLERGINCTRRLDFVGTCKKGEEDVSLVAVSRLGNAGYYNGTYMQVDEAITVKINFNSQTDGFSHQWYKNEREQISEGKNDYYTSLKVVNAQSDKLEVTVDKTNAPNLKISVKSKEGVLDCKYKDKFDNPKYPLKSCYPDGRFKDYELELELVAAYGNYATICVRTAGLQNPSGDCKGRYIKNNGFDAVGY